LSTTIATFLNQPISIETADAQNKPNWSVVTITSPTNELDRVKQLEDCCRGFCGWVSSQLEREADCAFENNQEVVCTINIRQEYLAEDVLPELRRRLSNYQGRTMATTAGRGGGTDGATGRTDKGLGGETGEEAYEEIRGT
jgi:hypothetical protein